MRDTTAEIIAKWKGLGTDNKVSAISELNRLNLEVATLTLFGKKLNCLSGPEHPMIKGMEDSTSEAMKRPNRPKFMNWLFYGGKFTKATNTMRTYAQELVNYRKANPTDRQDLLAILLNATDPETGTSLTDSQIIDEI
ncbi:hypothetical protein PC116_g34332, partial [Phytophthora cactorum]